MTAPSEIVNLVSAFQQQLEGHQSEHLNETQTRIQFIDPFFEALGWDINNKQNLFLLEQEVIHEDRLNIADSKKPKAPDYSFRIANKRQFFVEAKKPSVNVGKNINAAFQLRRYGWSAKLPISLLTNFQELAIYDCRIMPVKTDSATQARIRYYQYTDYVEKWDEIHQIFSKEAVLKGSLRQFSEEKIKTGIPVDKAFLNEIEIWRENLATNIAFRNPQLQQRELNFAVQMTINRLVFLRICEDRGIDPYEQLFNLLQQKNIYQQLSQLFLVADDRYNSGLFHFKAEKSREKPDYFTLKLQIDNFTLKSIIQKLYYPESPYEFSIIPVEILGQVYEQFLGKIIRLSVGRKVSVEDKPEVRKSGGVYYTPSYIVDYIVQQAIGSALEGKTPEKAKDITILDPACGSGSFLIVAYQYLLDWYLTQYTKNIKKYREKIYQVSDQQWALKSAVKKDILLTHIYGVDIDKQAVEMTKLSLLLKVLEGESRETLMRQLELFKERALPDLDYNIQCGNSLIDGEFYKNNQLNLLDKETRYRVNIFDWQDSFSKVMKSGGFDVIIGNPPYVRIQILREWASLEVDFYKQNYISANKGNYDIYVIFIEKGLNLLKQNGRLGFILPHKFFNAQYGKSVRNIINQNRYLEEIIYFGDQQVFENATTYTCLLFLSKKENLVALFGDVKDIPQWTQKGLEKKETIYPINIGEDWNFGQKSNSLLFDKLSAFPCVKLGTITNKISQGIRTSANDVYVVDLLEQDKDCLTVYSKAINRVVEIENGLTSYFLQGKEIKRYQILSSNKIVIIPYLLTDNSLSLIDEETLKQKYPKTFNYFVENKTILEDREQGKMKNAKWYAYVYPKNLRLMKEAKILIPDIANQAAFSFDDAGIYAFTSGYGITLNQTTNESIKYVLGLLNSNLLDFYLKRISTPIRGGFFRYFTQFIEQLPIRLIDFSNSKEKLTHDQIVQLVDQIILLYTQQSFAQSPPSRKMIENQIQAIDKRINQYVYELYGVNDPKEIAIIEGTDI